MSIFSLVGLCLVCAVAVFITRELKRDLVPLVVVTLGVIVFLACLPRISETVDFLKTLTDYAGEERVKTVLRALGIAYLTSVAAELCRTCGEQSVVTYIETAGKISLLALAVPLFKELIEIALIK